MYQNGMVTPITAQVGNQITVCRRAAASFTNCPVLGADDLSIGGYVIAGIFNALAINAGTEGMIVWEEN